MSTSIETLWELNNHFVVGNSTNNPSADHLIQYFHQENHWKNKNSKSEESSNFYRFLKQIHNKIFLEFSLKLAKNT